ncbi:MAG: Crp/Fnr family transcriptional regulator [Chloroflexi bacterium]|nr:Crp/Fnr family transcriptional regulator [Chloroflexota bacterium]
MQTLENLLLANTVFASLTPSDLKELARLASMRTYQKEEKVILHGEVWPYLFLVGEGSMDAVKESAEGRNLLVTTFPAGQIFWGLAFFQVDAPMPVTLQTHESSRLYLWQRDAVMPILVRNGQAAWELCRLMAVRMQYASGILEGLAFQSVAGRLARLLLDHFETAGESSISRHLTLDEMAARVGSTREMVCRALYSFSDRNLIEVTRTEFVLRDRDGLTKMVG